MLLTIEPVVAFSGFAGMMALSGIGLWMFVKRKRRGVQEQTPDLVEAPFSFEEELVREQEVNEPVSERKDDPFLSCFVYAHYGRFDLCEFVLKERQQEPGHEDRISEMLAWAKAMLSMKGVDWRLTWKDEWLSSSSDPVSASAELVRKGSLEEARELLETALFESRGEQGAVRKALREVNALICSPGRKVGLC